MATRSCYLAALIPLLLFSSRPGIAWESWGGDPGGSRFSPLREITPDNVGNLVRAFEFHTGDLAARPPGVMRRTKFQATPLFVEDSLVFCSPFNEVIALDPGTGAQKWRYDPRIAMNQRPANRYVCRGVTYWIDDEAPVDAACRSRIFMGTNDVRLIALDAKTGIPCAGFGEGGEVRPDIGMKLEWPGEFQITSPPAVGRGVVVVGSAIGDNRRVDAPSGVVRAFDARSGQPRWTFEPLKRDGIEAGHANVWAPMSVDAVRGLVFLPTSSPSPDFWGGKRPGKQRTCQFGGRAAHRDGRARMGIPNRASRRLGLRSAGATDAHAHRRRRWSARCRDPADQAGLCLRARSRHRQAGVGGRGAQRPAGGRGR
ncbi:glucose dehydrogenase [Bradyrhizobium sp. GM7.3]